METSHSEDYRVEFRNLDEFYVLDLDDCGGRVCKYVKGHRKASYRVDLPNSCNCPAYAFQKAKGKQCKHIDMVSTYAHPRLLSKDEARQITKDVIDILKKTEGVCAVEVADFRERDGMILKVTLDVVFDSPGKAHPVLMTREGLQFQLNILYLK